MKRLLFLSLGAFLLLSACTGKPAQDFENVQVVQMIAQENQFLPREIKVKALRKTRLEITSVDYDYDIEIPALGVGLTSIPAKKTVRVYFTPLNTGTFEFTSRRAGGMNGAILVQACPPEIDIKNPVPATAASLSRGKEIYTAQCASCHGDSGRGDGAASLASGNKPIDFTKSYMVNIADGELFWIIRDGWYGMPPFKNKLSEEDRWHVVNYLRTLHKP